MGLNTATLNGSPSSFEAGIELALARDAGRSRLPVLRRTRSGGRSSRVALPRQRYSARLAALVVPLEHHSRRRAAGARGTGPAVGSRGARRQVERMLADSRAAALVSNFAGQWLHLRNMRSVAPDPEAFPEFDENLRDAFRQETELFIETPDSRGPQRRRTADGRLHLPQRAPGAALRHRGHLRDPVPPRPLADGARRGLLGQGSILTVTSYPNRTSPTLRGKWVLENLLGAPPPAPPPNVPSLDEATPSDGAVGARADGAAPTNPVCASCHAPMDPLGLALENFDAIGKWRTRDGLAAIDASTRPSRRQRLRGPGRPADACCRTSRDRFAAALTEKLLTYALGRGVEYHDGRRDPPDRARRGRPATIRWSSLDRWASSEARRFRCGGRRRS